MSIEEHMGLTRAKARLRWREKSEVGIGTARLNPADRDIAEIGGVDLCGRERPDPVSAHETGVPGQRAGVG